MVCRESLLRYTQCVDAEPQLQRYGLPGIASEIHYKREARARMICYGLPGIASEIHCQRSSGTRDQRRYGLPGIASEIHSSAGDHSRRMQAMVCRESLLRYTAEGVNAATGSCYGLPGIASEIHLHCDADRLSARRYGLPGIASEIHSWSRDSGVGTQLWFAGNRF